MRSHLASGLGLLLSLAVVPASAVEWTIGAAIGAAPDYEGSDDYRPAVLPLLLADKLYHPATFVLLRGGRIVSNLLPHNNLRVGPMLEYIPVRVDVDDDKVDDFNDNGDTALMLGVRLGYDFVLSGEPGAGNLQKLGFRVDPRFDVLEGNGALVTFGPIYTRAFGGGRWFFEGRFEGTWASDDYMENAFDVSNRDASRTGLDRFRASAAFKDVEAFTQLTYRLTDHWGITGALSYSRLFGDAKDSPIVDDRGDENQFLVALGVAYQF